MPALFAKTFAGPAAEETLGAPRFADCQRWRVIQW
jgi:hypothetical protein